MEPIEDKAGMRKRLLAQRSSLPLAELQRRSQLVVGHLKSRLAAHEGSAIALYRSFRGEVDLSGLEAFWPLDQLYYPRTLDKAGRMEFYRHPGTAGFERSAWGLEEPAPHGSPLIADSRSVILVPAIAFDRQGHRLGYGSGYYDRYLKNFPGISIGICLHDFLLERIPNQEHDHPVLSVVTDHGFF